MTTTPQGNRLHVGIFGETNAGKSSLFNALIGTDTSIVSRESGTTTDHVQKALELVPFGPIVLIDTAGLGDKTSLGRQRMEKTQAVLDRIDFAIYVVEATGEPGPMYEEFKNRLKARQTPHLLVLTKCDTGGSLIDTGGSVIDTRLAVSVHQKDTIKRLRQALVEALSELKGDADSSSLSLLGGLLPAGSTVLMVMPVDSAAPKGRLILPQAQLIRDCLDNGFMAYSVTEKEIAQALANIKKVDLVVTDSQVFGLVAESVPKDIMLTSFSILMTRQKARNDMQVLIDGINAIKAHKLKDNDKILIAESCTHTRTHEDIGQVKIPAALRKITGKDFEIKFTAGRDYPADVSEYALIIHCGACMITQREMQNHIDLAKKANVPITNYGLFLAHASGILDRSTEIFKYSRYLSIG